MTHNQATGGANLKTYMNHIIKNRFRTLGDRCKTPKFKNLTHYADVYAVAGAEEQFVSEETPETLFEQREEIMIQLARLGDFEADKIVLLHLAIGHGIRDMQTATGLSRPVIIGAINRIDAMARARKAEENGNDD